MKLHIRAFGGIAPATNPRDLPESGAQTAVNVEQYGGTLKPMRGPSTSFSASFSFLPRTLYRYGDSVPDATPVWWAWTNPDIDIARTQIASDDQEWTFWTGETSADDPLVTADRMRGTYWDFANGTDSHGPQRSFAMYLPAPTVPIAAGSLKPDTRVSAKLQITGFTDWIASVAAITASSTNAELSWRVTTHEGVVARQTATGSSIRVTPTSGAAPLLLDVSPASTPLLFGTYTAARVDNKAALDGFIEAIPGISSEYDADTDVYTITTEKRGYEAALKLEYGVLNRTMSHLDSGLNVDGVETTPELNQLLEDWGEALTWEKADVLFQPRGAFGTAYGDDGDPGTPETRVYTYTRVYKTATGYEIESAPAPTGDHSTVDVYPRYNSLEKAPTDTLEYNNSGTAMREVWLGEFYPHDAKSGTGTDDFWHAAINLGIGTFAVRIYRATAGEYLLVDELEYTAAGALADEGSGDEVVVQHAYNMETSAPYWRPGAFEGGNGANTGLYIPAMAIYNYVDRKQAADLELTVLPSLTWVPAPDGMRGLVNLPNGMMAGFIGRDVYFCDPYRPHAWPLQYVQTVDFDVVALATMDTTLVVLTEGTPYFMQGSHPDVMTVVQGQVKQSCASKRSVVSLNGMVLYASPDGLIQIAPSGSANITQSIIKPQQWRADYSPSTISAFDYEGQYIAFWDATVDGKAGFILDPAAQRFVHHDYFNVEAGYHDRRDGTLYVARTESPTLSRVREWDVDSTTPHDATWVSKIFVLPYITSFGWAQVAADDYTRGVIFQLYIDGVWVYTYTPTSRSPFRLPVAPGREAYVVLEDVATSVFSVTLAQSGHELLDT